MTTPLTDATLEPLLVGDISGRFFVPAYQRGYRWGADEVGRLLDDIWSSTDESYYLQPVVVKKMNDGRWELVDGQQRLTTLLLIFRYMRNHNLQNGDAPYSLEYDTRPDSAAYHEAPNKTDSRKNIDFFHIFGAYQCISNWFETDPSKRQYIANKFYSALFERVKIIWYEAPESVDSTTLFTRLNVGRIPLTDAELVKALLLSRTGGQPDATDRTLEIAAQWDAIERDLWEPELWAFATGSAVDVPTRISLLLDSLADGAKPVPPGLRRPLFHTFETLRPQIEADAQSMWESVVDRHSLLLGWFGDRSLAHKIGYLVAQGVPIGDLVDDARGLRKSEFDAALDGRITGRLNLSEEDVRGLSYSSKATSRALFLMNVEAVRTREHSSERYSFKEHATGRWSLEHIHAQNAQSLTRVEQWRSWLNLHRDVLLSANEIDNSGRHELLSEIDRVLALDPMKEADFRSVEQRVVQMLSASLDTAEVDMDSIANLALLAGGDNSALSNSTFAVKRVEILDRDREGSYIPVCTRNVFLKYYSPANGQQMHFWSSVDREHYLTEMIRLLNPYLTAAKPGEEVAA